MRDAMLCYAVQHHEFSIFSLSLLLCVSFIRPIGIRLLLFDLLFLPSHVDEHRSHNSRQVIDVVSGRCFLYPQMHLLEIVFRQNELSGIRVFDDENGWRRYKITERNGILCARSNQWNLISKSIWFYFAWLGFVAVADDLLCGQSEQVWQFVIDTSIGRHSNSHSANNLLQPIDSTTYSIRR